MKIYWENRERKKAPLDATFALLPFFSQQQHPFLSAVERIDQLPPPVWGLQSGPRSFEPEFKQWEQQVRSIQSSKKTKLVLARKTQFYLQDEVDPLSILSSLKQKSKHAFLFAMIDQKNAFLGASPERLFYRKNQTLWTEALAGTQLLHEKKEPFLKSKKNLKEFLPVEQFLKEALAPILKSSLLFSPLQVFETHHLQHLYKIGTGSLKDFVTDRDILASIHPTPAISGMPPKEALSDLKKSETFDRSLYGGVLGWSTKEESEWAVLIRCCLIEDNRKVSLFAGTGIVDESDPYSEWNELNAKTSLFEDIFV